MSGDIDGLFACVHQILSTSTEVRAIVGTGTGRGGETAEASAALAREMLELMGMTGRVKVYPGAPGKLKAAGAPARSPGVQAIIDEAMRTDTTVPLFVAVGGGLTEVASALMLEPRIADRFTLVWIGGDAYPAGGTGETNFNIDPLAAQFVFNDSPVRIWQIPRSVYATCLVSDTEIQAYVAPHGAIGAWLYQKVVDYPLKYMKALNMGETWSLGDSPLVVLTALTDWSPSAVSPRPFKYERTGSSAYETVPAPHLNADGTSAPQPGGRMIRVYRSVDTRMMFSDFFAKLQVNFTP
ncbi:nucleoside hydrolase [Phenylobacterium sp. LjRoot225]|uniref:nucleoside hydrolase n=1 Tax=Phenylobacterium sp. LjRoot225 TaxID=3342285 RepID=UPI003ED07FA3